jgi:lipid-A-disaccharide synthase
MKYYLIAGEASGDLHGSNLIKNIQKEDTEAEFRFWGGEQMAKFAGEPVKHYEEMAFMGFVKVLTNIRTIKRNINECRADVLRWKPDVLILIDFAGFNLQIASFAKANNITVYYYISPKIWAWKTNRVHKIKRYVDKMYTILPFETAFYKQYGFDVNYVGNPVVDAVDLREYQQESFGEFTNDNALSEKPILAALPGSRKQEIKLMLPKMLKMQEYFPEYQVVVAGAPGLPHSFYEHFFKDTTVPIIYDKTYRLLQQSTAAMVTSGTATLETALLSVPQIVCYSTNVGTFLYKLGRKILKVKWISLVNLILKREAVKEKIQDTFTIDHLRNELNLLVNNSAYRQSVLDSYTELKTIIGNSGASERAAKYMVASLREESKQQAS